MTSSFTTLVLFVTRYATIAASNGLCWLLCCCHSRYDQTSISLHIRDLTFSASASASASASSSSSSSSVRSAQAPMPRSVPVQPPPLSYRTMYYNQTLDHDVPFSEEPSEEQSPSSTFFQQRVLINDTYFGRGGTGGTGGSSSDSGSSRRTTTQHGDGRRSDDYGDERCLGPIFFYTGNEGPVEGFWDSNGFMQYLTVKYGGLLVMAEQRYYGQSVPTRIPSSSSSSSSSSSTSTKLVLTTQQVLEDYVAIIHHIKDRYRATSCPVIAFGGSYGGTLAALLRQKYPWTVQGALSSSSEFGYYDVDRWPRRGITRYTFSDIIGKSYYDISPECLRTIYDASETIDDFARSDPGLVTATFNFCSNNESSSSSSSSSTTKKKKALRPTPSSTFVYGLEGLPQMNYPYQIGQRPGWPVRAACNMLLEQDQDQNNFDDIRGDADRNTTYRLRDRRLRRLRLLQNAAKVTAMSLGYSLDDATKCFAPSEGGPGNVPGDGPGLGSWGYQSCTETLHEFSSSTMTEVGLHHQDGEEGSNGTTGRRHYGLRDYDYESRKPELDELCHDLYGVTPNTRTLAENYGGFDIVNVTSNTIFSMGELDPWGGGFVVHEDEVGDERHRPLTDRGVYGFRMLNGAHHLDLRGWHQDEPLDVRKTRLEEEQIIVSWITQHFLPVQNPSTSETNVLHSSDFLA